VGRADGKVEVCHSQSDPMSEVFVQRNYGLKTHGVIFDCGSDPLCDWLEYGWVGIVENMFLH